MKKATQLFATTLFFLAVVILASLAVKPVAHSSVIQPGATDLQVITISAQRMTAEQKAAFDREHDAMPTLTVTAKAMSTAQKAAYDREHAGAGN